MNLKSLLLISAAFQVAVGLLFIAIIPISRIEIFAFLKAL